MQRSISEIEKHPWNSEPEVAQLINVLIDLHSCKSVLEVGVFKGATYYDISENCIVYTGIDVQDHREKAVKEQMELRGHYFILGDSLEELKKLKGRFDLIFIDSIHEYGHCLKEFKLCERLINKGGLVVFHDSLKFEGVKKVMEYIKSFSHFDVINLNTPDHEGRGGASGVSIVRCNYE